MKTSAKIFLSSAASLAILLTASHSTNASLKNVSATPPKVSPRANTAWPQAIGKSTSAAYSLVTPLQPSTTLAAATSTPCTQYASACAAQTRDRLLVCSLSTFNGNAISSTCKVLAANSDFASCQSMASTCTVGSAEHFYSSTTTPRSGYYTGGQDSLIRTECPSGQFAQGMDVRWGHLPSSPVPQTLVQSVSLLCTSDIGTAADKKTVRAAFGKERQLFTCDPGQLLNYFDVSSGAYIDSIAARCITVAPVNGHHVKFSGKMGGTGGGSNLQLCGSVPDRFVYGMIASYANLNGMNPNYRYMTSIQFLCR